MSQRYLQLQAQRRSVTQLRGVIGAMQGMAASRLQQCKAQLDSVQRYADTIAAAIAQTLALTPAEAREDPLHDRDESAPDAIKLLLCAEQGFAGAFSENIWHAAALDARRHRLMLVGSRGIRLARAQGWTPDWTEAMVAQLDHVGAAAERIGVALALLMHKTQIRHVDIVFASTAPDGRPDAATADYRIRHESLLPFDAAPFRPARNGAALPPLLNLPARQLLDSLASEHLFAQLSAALVQHYAAENAARLQTLAAAREHIDTQMEALTKAERMARQEDITAEIIELAAGAQLRKP